MSLKLLFLLLALVDKGLLEEDSAYESHIYLGGFSSKTAYRNSKLLELDDDLGRSKECKLVHINALFRHGTRTPGAKDLKNIELIHNKFLASHGTSSLPRSFINWKSSFSPNQEDELTAVGYEEMKMLGRRFRSKVDDINGFKDFLKHVKVTSSSVSRSRISAETFIKSFLRKKYSETEIDDHIIENDAKLRFFEHCPRYTESVLKNISSRVEFRRFLDGSEVRRVVSDIRQRWKLYDTEVTGDDIQTLFEMCGLEIATNMSVTMRHPPCRTGPGTGGELGCPYEPMFTPEEWSPLCSLFEPHHYAVFEYLYDLGHFSTKSYARKINWVQSCVLLEPMVEQILEAVGGHRSADRASTVSRLPLEHHLDTEPHLRASFWFGHAETLLPLITLLGLFNQSSPMSSTDYLQRLADLRNPEQRFATFRVSNISPFSGNVALEVYHCHERHEGISDGRSASPGQYRVQVRSNEKSVSWPLAGGGSHVSLDTFVDHFGICVPPRFNHHELCAL